MPDRDPHDAPPPEPQSDPQTDPQTEPQSDPQSESRRREIFRGRIVTLVTLDDRWEVVEHAPAVAVLALRDGRVLGVRQFRPAVGRDSWELPAGLVDPGERPLDAAARELAEEAQLAGDLELLQRIHTSPGFTDEVVYLFRARALVAAHGRPDADEELTVEWRDPERVWEDVAADRLVTSAPTLVGVRHALAELQRTPPPPPSPPSPLSRERS